jgi:hypothetical protein
MKTPPPIHHSPKAGMVETFPTGQVVYLAPLPLPTDLPAQDYGHAVGEVNNTYMDFGVGLPSVFAWQMGLGAPFWSVWFFGLFGPAIFWVLTVLDNGGVDRATMLSLQFMPYGFEVGLWGASASLTIYLYITFSHLAKYKTVVPTASTASAARSALCPTAKPSPSSCPGNRFPPGLCKPAR